MAAGAAAASLFQNHGCFLCSSNPATTTSFFYPPRSIAISSSLSSSSSSSILLQSVLSERKPTMIPVILDRSESIHGFSHTVSDLSTLVNLLRSSNKHTRALIVMQWMTSKGERFNLCESAMAVLLDLIAIVRGIPPAEDFFASLPIPHKHKRTHFSMLHAYARAKMEENADLLWRKMRENPDLVDAPLPFNIMMELYKSLGDSERVDSLVADMDENGVALDSYSYTLWISSQKSTKNVEIVYERMKKEKLVTPDWRIMSSMAGVYIKLGEMEEGERWVREMEEKKKNREGYYHHLMNQYSEMGKREEVVRVWEEYKKSRGESMAEWSKGYYVVIASMMKVGDMKGAKEMYYEWLWGRRGGENESRIGNLFIGWYVRVEGSHEKAEEFFKEMLTEEGCNANSYTWGLMAEGLVNQGSVREALGCINEAIKACKGGRRRGGWKPCQSLVNSMIRVFMEKGDGDERKALGDMLVSLNCIDDETCRSLLLGSS